MPNVIWGFIHPYFDINPSSIVHFRINPSFKGQMLGPDSKVKVWFLNIKKGMIFETKIFKVEVFKA